MAEAHVVHLERRLKARPEDVFDAWTKPEILARWWGPEGMHLGKHHLDLCEGGHWRTAMVNDETGAEHIAVGIYKVIDPPSRLVISWAWEEDGVPGPETEVSVLIEPDAQGSRLTLLHRTFETAEARDNHEGGWTSSLNCLERQFSNSTSPSA